MGGCVLVIWGWTVIGLILEAYGFWLLFCEFIPTALQFFRRVPIMSRVLDLPVMKAVRVQCSPAQVERHVSTGSCLIANLFMSYRCETSARKGGKGLVFYYCAWLVAYLCLHICMEWCSNFTAVKLHSVECHVCESAVSGNAVRTAISGFEELSTEKGSQLAAPSHEGLSLPWCKRAKGRGRGGMRVINGLDI
eukprot:1157297-Pelagomonas_calceolata.AAC.9